MKDRIRKLRKVLDLTQQDFAKKIGMSANVLTNYETGRRNPSRSVINNICKTFHVNEKWLRTGAGEMFANVSWADRIEEFVGVSLLNRPNSFQTRFLAMLSNLDESDWEVLERMARAIIGERTSNAQTTKPEQPAEQAPPLENQPKDRPLTIDERVELYRQQLLLEEDQDKQASSVNESGAG